MLRVLAGTEIRNPLTRLIPAALRTPILLAPLPVMGRIS